MYILSLMFPTWYVIPKNLKVGHWLSEKQWFQHICQKILRSPKEKHKFVNSEIYRLKRQNLSPGDWELNIFSA